MQQVSVRHFVLAATVLALSIVAGAQSPSAAPVAATPKWSYDAVSIKPDKSAGMNMSMMMQGNSISAENARIVDIVSQAYGIKVDLISGLPGWANDARYDIAAKLSPDDAVAFNKLNNDDRKVANQVLVQGMLADRFKLKEHIETKELPVYDLVLAKGGSKLKPAAVKPDDPNAPKGPDGRPRQNGFMSMGPGTLGGQGVKASSLANILSNLLHRTVIDKTGLTDSFDFSLKYAPDSDSMPMMPPGYTPPPASADDPSIFVALEEQLGLKLVSAKGPVNTLVIDHLEQPTVN
jgi:uncharacterized protein (TIGR03435 family)